MALQTITRTITIDVDAPPQNLPESDGIPMESDWHRLAMWLLIDVTSYFLRPRQDYFVGGNMFIYYGESKAGELQCVGPDYFLVWDVPLNPPRRVWAVWNEQGQYPDLIIELLSASTAKEDRTTKKRLYEKVFSTSEYFLYDPETEALAGFRLQHQRYQAIKSNERGWLWCEQLGLWLGLWTGTYLEKQGTYPRFFDAEGKIIPTWAEAAQQQAQAAQQQAQAAQQGLAKERQRADAAEAELVRLKEQLAKQPPNGR